ncbi:hypothetical protein HYV83_05440 [Candidatus Woesearchaeota archaeon]|nr:hypothetical protein [Candidatus Woesearchaeota archaeon]
MADLTLLIGVLGMAIILALFVLSQMKKLSQDSTAYDAANAVGAFMLVYYAFALKAWPFLILNAVWGGFSLFQVIGDTLNRKKKR